MKIQTRRANVLFDAFIYFEDHQKFISIWKTLKDHLKDQEALKKLFVLKIFIIIDEILI